MELSPQDTAAQVGVALAPSRWFHVDQGRIDSHADSSEDHQFIHVDPDKAAQSPFGGTIAHGFLTLSLLSAMAYDAMPTLRGEGMGVNYGLNHLRFLAPVPVGADVRGHFTLQAIEERKPNEFTLTWGVEVEIKDYPKPALAAEWVNRRYLEPSE